MCTISAVPFKNRCYTTTKTGPTLYYKEKEVESLKTIATSTVAEYKSFDDIDDDDDVFHSDTAMLVFTVNLLH